MTYHVVGCKHCYQTFIRRNNANETVQCSRCRKQLQTKKLRVFAEADTIEEARVLRGKRVSQQAGYSEEFETLIRD